MYIRDVAERIAHSLGGFLFTRDAVSENGERQLHWLHLGEDATCLGRLGRFRVNQLLGSGGTGTVLLAQDPKRNRQVALKVLNPEIATNPRVRRRFFREAKIAMSLHHPNVVSTHEVDRNPERPCIVSEYMAGGSLQQLLARRGPLPLSTTIDYGIQIARGLEAIHKKGLVHSDIKPRNILLDGTQRVVKISDFGLARVVHAKDTLEDQTVFATPQYASPEQVQGYRIDHRSDLYSMGGVLYAMCTARPPFPGESTVALIRKVCNAQPHPINEINPAVPAWLSCVVNKMMSKNRSSRYSSAADVERALTSHR